MSNARIICLYILHLMVAVLIGVGLQDAAGRHVAQAIGNLAGLLFSWRFTGMSAAGNCSPGALKKEFLPEEIWQRLQREALWRALPSRVAWG